MNKKYDLTILIPGIRTSNWLRLYNSLKTSCKQYTWELVFVSPFDLPEEFKADENVRLIKDFGTIPRCVQKAVPFLNSDIFYLTVDDCYFSEDSIDYAVNLYKSKCNIKDVVSVSYGEGGNLMDSKYWTVAFHPDLNRLPGIPKNYKIANQCIINKECFIELGGFDCLTFEYMDKPIHDFMFRLQKSGGNIVHSDKHACIATWYPGEVGDHSPVHHAQVDHDEPIFIQMYLDPDILNRRVKIDYDNWKQSPAVWKRRFPFEIPSSYE